MRVVVALGDNTLLKRGEPMSANVQRENVKITARDLADIEAIVSGRAGTIIEKEK